MVHEVLWPALRARAVRFWARLEVHDPVADMHGLLFEQDPRCEGEVLRFGFLLLFSSLCIAVSFIFDLLSFGQTKGV
jgi:hypothetical protein